MLAFGGSGVPVIEDARLRECNYGDLNGTSADHIGILRAQHIDVPYPNGQSYRQVVEQVRELLRHVAKSYSGKRVVFIGHSATKWALDHLLEGRDLREAIEMPFDWREGWHYELSTEVFQEFERSGR